jgi:hypothetical protein
VDGLAVDAELRWNIWHALAANGQATVAELDAELARDTTASGRAGHATTLAVASGRRREGSRLERRSRTGKTSQTSY